MAEILYSGVKQECVALGHKAGWLGHVDRRWREVGLRANMMAGLDRQEDK